LDFAESGSAQPAKGTILCRCQGRVSDAAADSLPPALAADVTRVDNLCGSTGLAQLARVTAATDSPLAIGCRREAPRLEAAAADSTPLRFFPAREYVTGGSAASPRLAALIAMARLPDPPPVESVPYSSHGRLAILGAGPLALAWAERLHGKADGQITVTVFAEDEDPLPATSPRRVAVQRARQVSVAGWLGAFEVSWTPANPVDASLCTGCNACLEACTSDAIVRDGVAAYVDLARCNDKRRCVEVCKAGAIDFSQAPRKAAFDLVLDLGPAPRLAMVHPPQGYFATGSDSLAIGDAALALIELVGDFDKPRYFDYKRSVCAHSRNRIEGCSRCIDTCSTSAISADGDGIRVEAHLCMGCGACASVCPSGAMRYNYPGLPHTGSQIRSALSGWQAAGGSAPTLLLHGRDESAELLAWAETEALPAGLLPLTLHDAASAGPDMLLYALCAGAGRVVVWQKDGAPSSYLASMKRAASFGNAVLGGLGLVAGEPRLVTVAGDAAAAVTACSTSAPALGAAARFHPQDDKRGTLDLCFRHLAALAPADVVAPIPLPEGSPYGGLAIDKGKCTLCLACINACPAKALSDDESQPRLQFREASCVQCGLCVATCPEDALQLSARLDLRPSARQPQTLNEDTPCHCVSCGKPFGSTATVQAMVARLSGHSLFATPAQQKRLLMCGDCRVIDMLEHGKGQAPETTVFDL
jgi:ferredoxin